MDDLISRRAAIKILHEALDAVDQIADVPFGVYQNYRDKMNELPPAPPAQPKRGRWVKLDMHRGMADHKCSVCEQECYVPTCMGEPMYVFCPNCGSYNGGENEI